MEDPARRKPPARTQVPRAKSLLDGLFRKAVSTLPAFSGRWNHETRQAYSEAMAASSAGASRIAPPGYRSVLGASSDARTASCALGALVGS